jgi:hypothetical protein
MVIRHGHNWIIEIRFPAGGFAGYVSDPNNLSTKTQKKGEAYKFMFDYEAQQAITNWRSLEST